MLPIKTCLCPRNLVWQCQMQSFWRQSWNSKHISIMKSIRVKALGLKLSVNQDMKGPLSWTRFVFVVYWPGTLLFWKWWSKALKGRAYFQHLGYWSMMQLWVVQKCSYFQFFLTSPCLNFHICSFSSAREVLPRSLISRVPCSCSVRCVEHKRWLSEYRKCLCCLSQRTRVDES